MTTFVDVYKQIEKAEFSANLKNGDPCYVIDNLWFEKFQKYANNPKINEPPPSIIDNSNIYDKDTYLNISQSVDESCFKDISVFSFNVLKKNFKINYEIKTRYYIDKDEGYLLKPVLSYFPVTVFYNGFQIQLFIYNGYSIEELHNTSRTCFNVDRSERTNLFINGVQLTQKILNEAENGAKFNLEHCLRLKNFIPRPNGNLHLGVTGICNMGNTCYMNSVLQCIAHTNFIADLFLNRNYRKMVTKGGLFTEEIANIVRQIWNGGNSYIVPNSFIDYLSRNGTIYASKTQEDAHEFLLYVINSLHEEFKTGNKVTVTEDDDDDELDVDEIDFIDDFELNKFNEKMEQNKSIIFDQFSSIQVNHIFCPRCNRTTVRFDSNFSLSLQTREKRLRRINFIFVPFDFKEPVMEITLGVPPSYKNYDFSKTASAIVGRNITVRVATKSKRSDSYKWSIGDEKDEANIYYLFEIPDDNHCYIPCNIDVRVKKNKSSVFSKKHDVTGPFLIQTNSFFLDDKTLQKSCKKALDSIWKADEFMEQKESYKINAEKKDLIETISWISKPEKPQYIIAFKGCDGIKQDDRFPNMSASQLTVEINKDYIDSGSLSYTALLHRYDPKLNEIKQVETVVHEPSVYNSLNLYIQDEILDSNNKWSCGHCKANTCASKKSDIWTAPEVLIIHLARFIMSYSGYSKDECIIKYPEILDLEQYVKHSIPSESVTYRLYAIIEHIGNMECGHYISFARVNDSWYLFNDNECSRVRTEDVLNRQGAYILFYQRI